VTPHINEILLDDCLNVLRRCEDASIDLVYLDPPFNTGQRQQADFGHYEDRWPDIDSYLRFMIDRLRQMHRVLRPTGSILLHCDWRACHHLRLALDEVFGPEHFVNHLIWSYGLGGSSSRRFARKHDDILFYRRSESYYFDPPQVPATSNRMRGQMKKATDVLCIPSINNMADERVGYPTQKPLALLAVLVNACCPSGGLVLDPFCGSGTSLVAAQRCSRRFLGIDSNPAAVAIARDRCRDRVSSP
jgi:DNA modification methylase